MAGSRQDVEAQRLQAPAGGDALTLASSSQRPAIILKKSRSYGDGHGFTCSSIDPEAAQHGSTDESSEEKHFEVKWDGADDPMNPKNMGKGRKWAVVFIVSAGSACV
ncbi:MAG: hypothetical protein Q9217_006633, partial [Psora testacea]